MRDSCLDCARKHLAQAGILIMEELTGDYPTHKWWAVGHMAEAADELMKEFPTLAHCVRTARLDYMENNTAPDINNLIEMVSSFEKPKFTEEDIGEGKGTQENTNEN